MIVKIKLIKRKINEFKYIDCGRTVMYLKSDVCVI